MKIPRPFRRGGGWMRLMRTWFSFFFMAAWWVGGPGVVLAAVDLDCDPCIDRSIFQLKALVPLGVPESVLRPLQQTAQDMSVALEIMPIPSDVATLEQALAQGNIDAWIVTAPDETTAATLEAFHQTNPSVPFFGWGWGYTRLAASTTLAWIADNAVAGGRLAAEQVQTLWQERADNTTANSFAMVHYGDFLSGPNSARWQAFVEATAKFDHDEATTFDLLPIVHDDNPAVISNEMGNKLSTCPYDVVLVADPALVPAVLSANQLCADQTLVAVFLDDRDTSSHPAVYQAITRQQVAFCINPAVHLQVSLAMLMAAVYVTTGKVLAMPIDSSTYWSGPTLITARNVPSDTAGVCEQEAFPVCQSGVAPTALTEEESDADDPSNTALATSSTTTTATTCPCTERREMRIGGVLHGDITDAFWDPVFAAAFQAADDMNIDLDLERFQRQEDQTLVYEQMAARIRNLCDSGIDGLFVTLPHDIVLSAVQRCQELRVPVVSVNTGQIASAKLGLVHYIGQDEYSGGYGGAIRLIEAGMKRGYCVDHAFGNPALVERCQGFRDGIADHGGDVTFGKHIDVPSDNVEQYVINVVQAVEADGGWEGVGLLGFGSDPYPSMQRVLDEHPGVVAGTFDTSDLVFEGIRDGKILFGIDQQPFLQGKMPVYLLSYMVYTHQALINHVIQSGPSFVEEYPSDAKKVCEANFYEVCPDRPVEDMTYIPDSFIAMGYALFVVLGVSCLVAIAWTYKYREKWVVKVSQPIFLYLIVFGVLISGLSIVFMGFQTSYRQDRDERGQFLDMANPDIGVVDASCMAVPWFYGMGFVITFSALFAKIYRVKLIYQAGERMQRKQVTLTDVMPVMAIMFVVEIGILLSWQLVAPLKWIREVTDELDGYATESVGSCDGGGTGWRFYLGLVLFHVVCLCYALVLCFQTKGINQEFAESSWLSLAVVFMFQVQVLAIPISALVRDNTDVFYFVRAAAVFLQNFTVLTLIFVPKMLRMHEEQRSPSTAPSSRNTSLRRQPTQRNSGRFEQSDEMAVRSSRIAREHTRSWGAASLTEDGVISKSCVSSEESLSAIKEESEETSGTREKALSVRFNSDQESGLSASSEHKREATKLLSPIEVDSHWMELGFPSRETAQMIINLVKRSTDPEQRKEIATGLILTSPKKDHCNTDMATEATAVVSVDRAYCEAQTDENKPDMYAMPIPSPRQVDLLSPKAFNEYLISQLREIQEGDNDADNTLQESEYPDKNGAHHGKETLNNGGDGEYFT